MVQIILHIIHAVQKTALDFNLYKNNFMSLFPKHNANMVACTVLVDCSYSMISEVSSGFSRSEALGVGLEILESEMKADPMVCNSVEVQTISIGGVSPHKATILQDWVYAGEFTPPELTANGSTPLGEALLLALDQVNLKKELYREEGRSYLRPWIIILSDGSPNDEDAVWNKAVIAAKNAITNKEALILSVGIDDCPLEKLNEISTYPAQHLSAHKFSEFFVWLSASMSATSQSSDSSIEQLASTDPWRVS